VQRIGVERVRFSTRGMPALIAGIGLLTAILGWGMPALVGCSESNKRVCAPEVGYGRIVGRIETGGYAVDASIRASRCGLGDWRDAEFEIVRPVDDEGRFALIVPAGEYTIKAFVEHRPYDYAADGAELGYRGLPDTLSVAAGDSVEVVLRFGSLIVEVAAAAPELDDREVSLSACVVLEDGDLSSRSSASATVRNGLARFTLPGLPAGDYALAFDVDRYNYTGAPIWLPGTRDPEAAELVHVTPGMVTTHAAQLSGRPAVVRGRVSGSWQTMGLDRGEFSVLTADSVVIFKQYLSESDGSFRGEIWIPELVRVACTIASSNRWFGGDDFASATQFELTGGEETDVGTIEESGLLLELIEPGYADHDDFDLHLVRVEDGALVRTRRVKSGTYGRTSLVPFPNLDPGTYYLRVFNSRLSMGWVSQWYDGATALGEATPVTIPGGGSVLPLRLTLQPGGTISGRVLHPAEDSPYVFVIYVVDAATRETAGRIHCDCDCCDLVVYGDDSPFSARGLPDGDYRVGAWSEDCCAPPWDAPAGTIWCPGTAEWETAEIVTIADHAAVAGVDIAWPQSGPRP
jgi:hypothetical protein